ncbi:hypothetical protein BU26DRAFT_515821 [Trematosphaeria pertusa]|uniref:Pal1-domain-containing protein n=1 Tax=Trematosphaeria pertusa TaxID=390896 RepID=A0A6A6IST0_9PLEO|nr:uncharacterized protein BU26DRAFT_515821 [Trematosphaeria pertusa]KAF2253466.1 hypothetical protein BU26DRAFT_515821 [Trematosphaeria pertusa]
MGSSKEFAQARHALIDPLVEPDPSEETGLNSHFGSTFAPRQHPPSPPGSAGLKNHSSVNIRPQHTGSTVETNPYRRSRASTVTKSPSAAPSAIRDGATPPRRRYDYPSPPNSASPRREHFSNHREEAFGSMKEGRPRRSSQPSSSSPLKKDGGLTRGGSLRERYAGDTSHRPLDVIRKDTKTAHRAHHLRKKNFQGADIIDRLDKSTLSYHHEGPYDAANIARNTSWMHSPVAAVADSNEEALKATPRENIVDAVTRHRPLEGTATFPPGVPDSFGRVYDYEEGADLQREPGGDYRRWPGVTYHPDDIKGKGEPYFTIDKALKEHKKYGDSGTELRSRRRNVSLGTADVPNSFPAESFEGGNAGVGRSNTTGKSMGSALKKRFGSLRRRNVEA